MTAPLVTAICPTLWPERAWCLPLAAANLEAQDLAGRWVELLVGTDCDSATLVGELMKTVSGRARLMGYRRDRTLGEKRALLCSEARGEWIAFWDDDDWKPPYHLATAIAECEHQGADLIAHDAGFFVDLVAWKAYRYLGMSIGTSLVFRKSVLERVPIPSRDRGEDTMFLAHCREAGVRIARPFGADVVAFCHGQTTGREWPPRVPEYREVPMDRVRELMGEELGRWVAAYGYGGS
jgi:hypothetical protein